MNAVWRSSPTRPTILQAVVHEYLPDRRRRRLAHGHAPLRHRSVAGDGAQRDGRSRGAGPAQAAAHLGRARADRPAGCASSSTRCSRCAASRRRSARRSARATTLRRARPRGVLQTTSRVLAELSQHAAIVITPAPERQRLEHVEFMRLRARPAPRGPGDRGRPGREQARHAPSCRATPASSSASTTT